MLQRVSFRRLLLVATSILCTSYLVTVGGCAGMTNTSMKPIQRDAPVQLSPDLQPLNDPGISRTDQRLGIPIYGYRPRVTIGQRPVSPQLFKPQPFNSQPADPRPVDPQPARPQIFAPDDGPSISGFNDDLDRPTGPLLTPAEPSPALPIVLTIDADERAQVGNGMTFEIAIRNPNEYALDNVIIESEFDDELVFPGHTEKRIRRGIGTIAAGETRKLAVMLSSDITGKHCVRFEVTADNVEPVRKEVCVEYIANDLEISILGPTERTVGSRAEFTIKLLNRADHSLTDVQLAVTYDPTLEPREGSAGAKFEKQSLSWNLDNLLPGEFVQVQVEFECLAEVENTCVIADVTSSELPPERKAECLRINELLGPLQVELQDTRDPIVVEESTEHIVTIINRSSQRVDGIGLVATIPAELDIARTGVEIDGEKIEIATDIDGDEISFNRIGSLPAGSTMTIRIESRASQAGDATIAIRVMYVDGDDAVVVREPMSINAE